MGLESWDPDSFGRGASWGWGILRDRAARPSRTAALPGRAEEGCRPTQLPDPGRRSRPRAAPYPHQLCGHRFGPAQPLNPEPAEPSCPAPRLPLRPRGRDPSRSAPAAGGGEAGPPSSRSRLAFTVYLTPRDLKISCFFFFFLSGSAQLPGLLRVLAAGGERAANAEKVSRQRLNRDHFNG